MKTVILLCVLSLHLQVLLCEEDVHEPGHVRDRLSHSPTTEQHEERDSEVVDDRKDKKTRSPTEQMPVIEHAPVPTETPTVRSETDGDGYPGETPELESRGAKDALSEGGLDESVVAENRGEGQRDVDNDPKLVQVRPDTQESNQEHVRESVRSKGDQHVFGKGSQTDTPRMREDTTEHTATQDNVLDDKRFEESSSSHLPQSSDKVPLPRDYHASSNHPDGSAPSVNQPQTSPGEDSTNHPPPPQQPHTEAQKQHPEGKPHTDRQQAPTERQPHTERQQPPPPTGRSQAPTPPTDGQQQPTEPSQLSPPLQEEQTSNRDSGGLNTQEQRDQTKSSATVPDSEEGSSDEDKQSKPREENDDTEEEEPAMDLYEEGLALIGSLDVEEKTRGYSLLETAAASGNRDAKEKLAYGYIFGTALERKFMRAFEVFTDLADQGWPAGQQGLGFMYATGIGIKSNQAKAILHYVFAALGGHHYAQMAMGYRALMGITVVQSCEGALSYYHKAAKTVVSESSLITGGQAVTKVRLMDEENEAPNIYGVSEDDMIHYHSVFADSGNTGAQLLLGMFYLYGMGGAERNFQTALRFLHQADVEGHPAASNLIGKIYAEGSEEVPRDYDVAMSYFQKSASLKHGDGFSGLGMMHLNGMGVEQDYAKAMEFFQQAGDRGSAEGQYYLGYMYLSGYGVRRDPAKALRYFQLASHGGHLQAIFSLAEMHAEGAGVKRNCNYAVELFKSVAERGKWSQLFMEAQKLYNAGDLDSALMLYTQLSELGFEVAQSNVAYLLEQEDITLVHQNESLERALLQWNRAAAQGYAVARVKLGDYYYYGQGTKVNYEAAASQYRMASDKQSNAQAMFNLGYMYELGLGLEQDYHLAKRYYDMAADTSSEAVVPVNLALLKLNCLYFYEAYRESLDYLMLDRFGERMQSVFGHSWDIYLISLLTGLVVLLVLWRRRH